VKKSLQARYSVAATLSLKTWWTTLCLKKSPTFGLL